ncbi:MAG: TonB-dependent receptor [Psychrobium sp.]|mgnify:CR=1 FL=1
MKFNYLALAVSAALLPLSAFAADKAPKKASDMEVIQVKGSYFNNYKVDKASGAMRMDTSLMETAQAVTVIPETIIDEQLATTLGEVLNNVASLSPGSKQRNREVFSSRGFTLSSSNGYLRDGHQHWSHYQQPIETLERVEVIKGPSSILYGQSAPGGLVNMVTKKPTDSRLFDLSFDTDQNGSTRFMADFGGQIVEDLTYRSVLVKQDVKYDREYQDGSQRERDRFLGSISVDYAVSDDLKVNVYFDRTNDKAGLDTGAWLDNNGDVIGDNKTIYDFSWAFTDITVDNLGANVSYFINPQWMVKAGYNEQTFERQRFESAPKKPSDYVLGDSYTYRAYDRFDDWQFKTAFVDVTGEFSTGDIEHQLLIGANSLDYYYGQLRTRVDYVSYTPGQPEPVRPAISYKTDDTLYNSEYDYYGFYFQDLVTFNDEWQVAFGGRFDQQNREGADSDSFVPKFGVLYHPQDEMTVYVNYSESFEPSSSETLNDESDINHGMKLDAVTSKQIEVGGKWQVSERLLVETAIFDIEKSGTLISQALPDNTQFDSVTTQSGLQRHKGFELSAQGAVTDRLFLMASTMYLNAKYERDARYQGKTPVDAPKWSASVWSRYEMSDAFSFNAGVFYQGKRFADTNNTVEKDAYARVNVGAIYSTEISGQDVDFRLNIENLFDTDYLAGGGLNNVTIGNGTMARFEVKTSF